MVELVKQVLEEGSVRARLRERTESLPFAEGGGRGGEGERQEGEEEEGVLPAVSCHGHFIVSC